MVAPAQFKDERTFLTLCQINGKYIETEINGDKQAKVAVFNEQCLNVDQGIFGDPSPEGEANFPRDRNGIPYNPSTGQLLPYEQFKPK